MRQGINFALGNKAFAMKFGEEEVIVKRISAVRSILCTEVTLMAEGRDGQPRRATYLMADAPDRIRDLVNDAFSNSSMAGA